MTAPLRLAYSPCPNDTYIFGALANGWQSAAGGFGAAAPASAAGPAIAATAASATTLFTTESI